MVDDVKIPTQDQIKRGLRLRLGVYAIGSLVAALIATAIITTEDRVLDYALRSLFLVPLLIAIFDTQRLSWAIKSEALSSLVRKHSYVFLILLLAAHFLGNTPHNKMRLIALVCSLILLSACILTYKSLKAGGYPELVRLQLLFKAANKK